MKFDPVHAVAIVVMRHAFGQMTVGKAGQFLHRFVPHKLAQRLILDDVGAMMARRQVLCRYEIHRIDGCVQEDLRIL